MIDANVHIYPSVATSRIATGHDTPSDGTLSTLLDELAAAGISRAIVANFLPIGRMIKAERSIEDLWSRQHRQNAWALHVAEEHARLSVLVGAFAPLLDSAIPPLEEMLDLPSCVGIKLHPSAGGYDVSGDDGVRLATLAQAHGKTLLVHSGIFAPGDPATTTEALGCLIDRVPECRTVIAHLGAAGSSSARELARRGPNVWLDTSEVLTSLPITAARDLLSRVLSDIPASRIVHGSGFPWYSVEAAVERLLAILPEGVAPRQILQRSAEAAYSLDASAHEPATAQGAPVAPRW